MLDFSRGTREIRVGNNLRMTLFPDEADENVFHYLPNFPHVAAMPDGKPGIRLFVYRENLDDIADDDPEAVAFLSLDVDVSWHSELIQEAAQKIRMEDNLRADPTLTPIFYSKGFTKLMLLDAQSPEEDAEPGAEAEATQFVTSILGGGSPSLYGDNRAIFQAALSKKGAAALSGALDGMTPIGVVYSLTFAGLQPAFNIRAKVDWQKIYDHFSEQKHLDLLFYERDIQKSIDTLIEDKTIEFEVTVRGIGAEAMDADRKAVEDSLRQMIFDGFFEATFERETAAGDSTGDNVVDALTHIHQNALTLGVGYTYKRKEVKVEELRRLNVDWSVRRAAERTIYPQAHMHTMLDEWGITEEDLVKVIDGSDDLWKTVPFEVIAAAAWDTDSIVAITVDVEYDDRDSGVTRPWTTTLTKEKDRDTHRDWMDRTSGSAFRYKYEVVFSPDGIAGPRPKVGSGEEWLEHTGTALILHPRELYEKIQLEVAALANFPFERWPAVQAVIRYRDESGYEHYEDGLITAEQRKLETNFRIDAGMEGTRDLRLTYVGAGGERIETEWMPMENDQWPIEDPRPDRNALVVQVIVAGPRKNIQTMTVDLEYADEEANIHETGRLTFTDEDLAPKVWTVHTQDPRKRRYRYRMTLVTKEEGDFIQTGWISTDAPTIPVGEKYVRRLTVEVVTGELKRDYNTAEVTLRYVSPTGTDSSRTFRLGEHAHAEWQVELDDPSQRSYEVTTTWISDSGFNRTVGPETGSGTLLVIPAEPPD